MIGDLVLYAANRAASDAVESATRKIAWGGLAVFLLLLGIVFALIVTYGLLEPRFGPTGAGALITGGCLATALLCLTMPKFLDWMERQSRKPEEPVQETVAAVQEEVAEAVDYFGPAKVVLTAFMLGFGAAKRLKS